MIKISNLTPWKREWSATAASSLSGLALALTVGFVSMSVLSQSDDALALNDCGNIPQISATRWTGTAWGPINGPSCGSTGAYHPGSERDSRAFPLTAQSDGTVPANP